MKVCRRCSSSGAVCHAWVVPQQMNAYRQWHEKGMAATSRAAGIAANIRGFAYVLAFLGALGAVAALVASRAEDSELGVAAAAYILFATALPCVLLLAVASALDLLRIQTELALFNDDDDEDD